VKQEGGKRQEVNGTRWVYAVRGDEVPAERHDVKGKGEGGTATTDYQEEQLLWGGVSGNTPIWVSQGSAIGDALGEGGKGR